MRKQFPLVLVLILVLTAGYLVLRGNKPGTSLTPQSAGPASAESAAQAGGDTPAPAAVPHRPWAHEASDIPADPAAVFGALPNGLRYTLYPNQEPPGRVALRLHIRAGSLMEADDQQGLAHFLEHMVFNGTRNHSAADLIPRMQRLGIAFGAHANAYTSFDETVYMLDLPDTKEETLKLAFTVMRDFGDGALLDQEEIDKERGVILSEMVSRDSVDYRIMKQQFNALLPGSLIPRRFPIGEESVLRKVGRERFVDFYNRYYVPSRMTFVISGDFRPEEMESRIRTTFASMRDPEEPGKDPDLGAIGEPEGLKTAMFHDKELSSTSVSLYTIQPFVTRPDTRSLRREKLLMNIANTIISRRFERLAEEKGSPVSEGSASQYPLFQSMEIGVVSATAADDRWREVVAVVEQELRRALEHGFTELELAEAKSNILNAYEQAVKGKATRRSEEIATRIASTLNENIVLSDPETDLAIAKEQLESIRPADCHQAFRALWKGPGSHLVLVAKEKPAGAEEELASLHAASRGVAVAPPAQKTATPFAYTGFGEPGTVRSRKEVADLGVTQLVLSNGVRVNLKPTDFQKGSIGITLRVGAGQLTQPRDKPMLNQFAEAILEGGGLGRHSVDELRQVLAGKNVGASFAVDEDAFRFTGTTTPADFGLQCRLLCASVTDPGFREEGLWQFQKSVPMLYQQLKHTPQGPLLDMRSWLRGGDPRYAVAPMADMAAFAIDDARNWVLPEFAKGYMEVAVVGDFAPADILPDLLATFGALPPRAPGPPEMSEARKVSQPPAPSQKVFTYDSKVPQAIAIALWKTAGLRGNQPEARRLNIVAGILEDRLREEVREKLGASYSPNASVDGSNALDDVGFLSAMSIGTPQDAEKLRQTMTTEAARFAEKGASADELDRALKPVLSMLAKSARENGYWLSTVLADAQADPSRLELARNREADYRSINLTEINTLAGKYLAPEKALHITIEPAKAK